MKGTLFSTDYVFDANGNPRLIELNTDTGAVNKTLGVHLHMDGFINMLSSSNITEVYFVYKGFQSNLVNWMNGMLTVSASFITSIQHVEEAEHTIYPTSVEDTGSRFILRMAYDENAILDSTYAKSKSNLHKLYTDYTASSDTVEYYYSGSDGIYDTIDSSSYLNVQHTDVIFMPDYVIKTKSENQTPVQFTKIGLDTSSSLERYTKFKDSVNLDSHYYEKFHFNPTDLSGSYETNTTDRKLESIRSFDIIYGDSLNLLNLGRYTVECYFDVPNSSSLTTSSFYDNDRVRNDYEPYHHHQLSTKFVMGGNGMTSTQILIGTGSNNFISSSQVQVSESIQSYYIQGADISDGDYDYLNLQFTGSTMISGSHITSSMVEGILTASGDTVGELILSNGEKIYTGLSKHIFTYNTSSNVSRYESMFDINKDNHFLYSSDGNIHSISEHNLIVLKNKETLYTVDVENVDTMLLSGSNVIVHNAPCFVAGTLVHTGNGEVPIEDIVPGDTVITWNHDTDMAELCEVIDTMVKEDERTVTYTFDNGTELTGTPDHPLYVIGKGYSSYYPKQTKDDSGLDVEQILIGDEVLHIDGYGVTITDIIENEETSTVYNLNNVEKNHNFFVENLLAHNRIPPPPPPTCFAAGTEISLSNGDTKNIEDIVVGDIVLGWDGEKISEGEVIAIDHRHNVGSHANACETLGDEPSLYTINDTGIEFTPEHPFLTKEGWKSLVPDIRQEPYRSDASVQTLELGDYINVDGEWEQIKEIKVVRSDAEETVYNMTVDKLHSYIANGIIVHNK